MQDYRNLRVWQKAHSLTLATYALSAHLQKPDAWPKRDQMFRAAISIPSNIAEGAGRGSDPDFRRFLWHSLGSCNELEYMICFLPAISDSCPWKPTVGSPGNSRRSGACSPASCSG
jgi:four helix bundle protein